MIKRIDSVNNSWTKDIVRLYQRKYRDMKNKFVCSGFNIVQEAIDRNEKIECLILREDLINNEIAEQAKLRNIDIFIVSDDVMNKISDTQTTQGVMAVVYKAEKEPYTTEKKRFMVVDKIQDPGNMGTIIRSAEAAGFSGIISLKGTVDVYSPKVVRAAAGAIFRMPILFMESTEDVIEYLRGMGCKLFVTQVDRGVDYYNVNFTGNIAIVIGNEGNGVSEEMVCKSDVFLNIPMRGEIESLNAAIAASILMFEVARQNS